MGKRRDIRKWDKPLNVQTVALRSNDRMLPLMKNSNPVGNMRIQVVMRFSNLLVRFDGRVYAFPIRDLARSNQLRFYDKRYTLNYRALIVRRSWFRSHKHSVWQFHQAARMKPYMSKNTELRQAVTNKCDRSF